MNAFTERNIAAALERYPLPYPTITDLGAAMRHLIANGLAELAPPGGGHTWTRWQALAAVAAFDLSLAKIYEGHTDALAILAELTGTTCEGLWAVWAAEMPGAKVTFSEDARGGTLSGRKWWCSGAAVVDHAVISAWTAAGSPVLARVRMGQPGVVVTTDGWNAVGMSASESVSVVFEDARAEMVGGIDDYLTRPGFWQGAAGIAAVWYGGAIAIARALTRSSRVASDPHAAAHLGAMDVSLRAARALLIETSAWIDAHPTADAAASALRVRACVEATAHDVLQRTGRALGAGPLCLDGIHARRCADLPVFLRQSHAEHDLAALGRYVAADASAWEL